MPRATHPPLYANTPRPQRSARTRTRATLPWFEDSTTDVLPVGVAPVVTWTPGTETCSLWVVGTRARLQAAGLGVLKPDGTAAAALASNATERVRALLQRLHGWLPGLWHTRLPRVEDLELLPVDAVKLVRREGMSRAPLPYDSVSWSSTVEGTSLEAACLLAAASDIADVSLHPGFLVSAEVDDAGALKAVQHTDEKRLGLNVLAPRLSELHMWAEHHPADVTLETLLDLAGLHEVLRDGPPGTAEEKLRALEDIVFVGSGTLSSWKSVARAADTVRGTPGISDHLVTRAHAARAIARRHDGLPDPEMPTLRAIFEACVPGTQAQYLAHFVQHATDDKGAVIDDETLREVRRYTAEVEQTERPTWPASIRLYGAWARNHQATWRREALAEGLRMSLVACEAWRRHSVEAEISYPLSEAYRLSGALGDTDAFARCERIRSRWEARVRPVDSAHYVPLARARAQVLLAEDAGTPARDAEATLNMLARDGDASPYLRACAHRWLRRASRGDHATIPDDPEQAALARLDDALAGRGGDVDDALAGVRLVKGWPAGIPEDVDPAWVARASAY